MIVNGKAESVSTVAQKTLSSPAPPRRLSSSTSPSPSREASQQRSKLSMAAAGVLQPRMSLCEPELNVASSPGQREEKQSVNTRPSLSRRDDKVASSPQPRDERHSGNTRRSLSRRDENVGVIAASILEPAVHVRELDIGVSSLPVSMESSRRTVPRRERKPSVTAASVLEPASHVSDPTCDPQPGVTMLPPSKDSWRGSAFRRDGRLSVTSTSPREPALHVCEPDLGLETLPPSKDNLITLPPSKSDLIGSLTRKEKKHESRMRERRESAPGVIGMTHGLGIQDENLSPSQDAHLLTGQPGSDACMPGSARLPLQTISTSGCGFRLSPKDDRSGKRFLTHEFDGETDAAPLGRYASREDEMRAVFRTWDSNGDGFIYEVDMMRVLSELGMVEEEIHEVFIFVDANSDGRVDYEEFVSWMYQTPVVNDHQGLEDRDLEDTFVNDTSAQFSTPVGSNSSPPRKPRNPRGKRLSEPALPSSRIVNFNEQPYSGSEVRKYNAEKFLKASVYIFASETLFSDNVWDMSMQTSTDELMRQNVRKANELSQMGKQMVFIAKGSWLSQREFATALWEQGLRNYNIVEKSNDDSHEPSVDAIARNVVSIGRVCAFRLRAFAVTRPLVITSDVALLEDLRMAGFSDYVSTIHEDGTPNEVFDFVLNNPGLLSISEIAREIGDGVDAVVVGRCKEPPPVSLAVAAELLGFRTATTSECQLGAARRCEPQMPFVVCCAPTTRRKIKSMEKLVAMKAFGAELNLEAYTEFDICFPSHSFFDVLTSSKDHGGCAIDTAKAVFISCDLSPDIEFANAAGMKSLLVMNSNLTRLELASLQRKAEKPHWVLPAADRELLEGNFAADAGAESVAPRQETG